MSTDYQDDETRVWYKATWQSLLWVLALTGLIRGAFLVGTHKNLYEDPDAYRKLAANVLETGVYGWKTEVAENPGAGSKNDVRPTAFRPPLYPFVLIGVGGVNSIWGIALLHLLLGMGTTGIVACLGWRAGLGRWSVVAAMLVALDPILMQQSTLVMTETLATFLASLTLLSLSTAEGRSGPAPFTATWRSVWPGIALGLCVLCRPTFLPWLGLIALARLVPWRSDRIPAAGAGRLSPHVVPNRIPFQTRVAGVTVLVAAALLVIAPWVLRNQWVMGRAKLTTTHGGYTVLLGNNPLFYGYLESGAARTWDGEQLSDAWKGRSLTTGAEDTQWNDLPELARQAAQRPLADGSEFADDALAYQLAWRYIRAQPTMFVRACGLRITRLWRLTPHRVGESESISRMTLRYLVGIWYTLVFALAIVGLINLRHGIAGGTWLYGLQLCFVFTGVHALYWSNMRMRAPLMPLVGLAAASGMAAIWVRFLNRKN